MDWWGLLLVYLGLCYVLGVWVIREFEPDALWIALVGWACSPVLIPVAAVCLGLDFLTPFCKWVLNVRK